MGDEELKREIQKTFPYKIELHVHLDGSVRPETILDIARNKGHPVGELSLEELKADCVLSKRATLKDLLHCFTYFMPVIAGDRSAIKRIAYEFCEDCAKQNTKYVEVRYSPHCLCNYCPKINDIDTSKGKITPEEVVETVCNALDEGARDFKIRVKSILCCMTHRPDWSAEVVRLCRKFKERGVVAIDSAGMDFKPGKDPLRCRHKKAFKEALDNGIHRTVHAGENGPAAGVEEALDHMYAERIGHGYHTTDDPKLYKRCLEEKIHFEICPLSSIRSGAVPEDMKHHPLLKFLKDDANFSINTDDPIVLDNDLTEDYMMVRQMGLTNEDIVQSLFNAARASFAPPDLKETILQELEDTYGPH